MMLIWTWQCLMCLYRLDAASPEYGFQKYLNLSHPSSGPETLDQKVKLNVDIKPVAACIYSLVPFFSAVCSFSAPGLSEAVNRLKLAEKLNKAGALEKAKWLKQEKSKMKTKKSGSKEPKVTKIENEHEFYQPLIQMLTSTVLFSHPTYTTPTAFYNLAGVFISLARIDLNNDETDGKQPPSFETLKKTKLPKPPMEEDGSDEETKVMLIRFEQGLKMMLANIVLLVKGLFILFSSFLPRKILSMLKLIKSELQFYRDDAILALERCFSQKSLFSPLAGVILVFYLVNVKSFINKVQTENDVLFCEEIFEYARQAFRNSLVFSLIESDFLACKKETGRSIRMATDLGLFFKNSLESVGDEQGLEMKNGEDDSSSDKLLKEVFVVAYDEEKVKAKEACVSLLWRVYYKNAIYNLVGLNFTQAALNFEKCVTLNNRYGHLIQNQTDFVAAYAAICYCLTGEMTEKADERARNGFVKEGDFYRNVGSVASNNSLMSLPQFVRDIQAKQTEIERDLTEGSDTHFGFFDEDEQVVEPPSSPASDAGEDESQPADPTRLYNINEFDKQFTLNSMDSQPRNEPGVDFDCYMDEYDPVLAAAKCEEMFAILSDAKVSTTALSFEFGSTLNLFSNVRDIYNYGPGNFLSAVSLNFTSFNLNNFQFGVNIWNERNRWAIRMYKKYEEDTFQEEEQEEDINEYYDKFLTRKTVEETVPEGNALRTHSFLHNREINNEMKDDRLILEVLNSQLEPEKQINKIDKSFSFQSNSSMGSLKQFDSASMVSDDTYRFSAVNTEGVDGEMNKKVWVLLDVVEVMALHLNCMKYLDRLNAKKLLYILFKEYRSREKLHLISLNQQLKVCAFTSDILFHQQQFVEGLRWAEKGIEVYNRKKYIESLHGSSLLLLKYLKCSNLFHMNNTLEAKYFLEKMKQLRDTLRLAKYFPSKDWLIQTVSVKVSFLEHMIDTRIESKFNTVTIRPGSSDFVELEVVEDVGKFEFHWNWMCEAHDIACDVLFRPSDGSEIVVVEKVTRVSTRNKMSIFGSYLPEKSGMLRVAWDNKFSLWKNKTITYNLELVRRQGE